MEQTTEDQYEAKTASTRLVLLESLAKIGFSTNVKEDGTIDASFAGRDYNISVSGYLVRIWETFWRTYATDDFEPDVKDAVTLANSEPLATIIYSTSEKGELTYLHTKVDFIFWLGTPNPEILLMDYFKAFYLIRRRFDAFLAELK